MILKIIVGFVLIVNDISTTSIKFTDNFDEKYIKPSSYIRHKQDIVEDGKLLVPDLVKKYGYACEQHFVVTPDGYILEIHRIPPKIKRTPAKPPLIFVPGLISSSADWTVEGPGRSLPLILADLGYDSWLLNARGNRYSRQHLTLDPDINYKEFFNFSYHEISVIDVPTVIDYMLNVTNLKQVIYFGHSQGTTISYIFCAEKPDYIAKVKALFSFAPSAFFKHAASIYHFIGNLKRQVQNFFRNIDMYEVPHFVNQAEIAYLLCGNESSLQPLCTGLLYYLFGTSTKQMNTTTLPILASHIPAGTSTKQGFHYLQAISTGTFRRYDYGIEGNLRQYGQQEPPRYNIENITIPIYLFYCKNDLVNSEKDVIRLFKLLKNAKKYLIPDKEFNHMDFLFGIDAPKLVFRKAIEILETL